MTVADFKHLSLGFVIDFCVTKAYLENGNFNSDEERYRQMKDIIDYVTEDYENGTINAERYNDFMIKFKSLEERYGWDY